LFVDKNEYVSCSCKQIPSVDKKNALNYVRLCERSEVIPNRIRTSAREHLRVFDEQRDRFRIFPPKLSVNDDLHRPSGTDRATKLRVPVGVVSDNVGVENAVTPAPGRDWSEFSGIVREKYVAKQFVRPTVYSRTTTRFSFSTYTR